MNASAPIFTHLSGTWAVLSLFIIPIGGGIPAGVLLAQNQGMHWIVTAILYFISDVLLACVFEPLMVVFIAGAKRSPFLARMTAAMKASMKKTTEHYGTTLGPLALIMISFGVDPMTGRAASKAAGHGFITGWLLAIAGDMIYFGVIMISTLWLHSILGDGTWTTLIILALMMGVPAIIKKIRGERTVKTDLNPS